MTTSTVTSTICRQPTMRLSTSSPLIERIIPSIRSQRMIGIRIGVRNTIHAWGPSEDDLSRSYEVVDHSRLGARNLFSVIGGKLASFRQQAEDAADAVSRHLGRDSHCDTHRHALPGAGTRGRPRRASESIPTDLGVGGSAIGRSSRDVHGRFSRSWVRRHPRAFRSSNLMNRS